MIESHYMRTTEAINILKDMLQRENTDKKIRNFHYVKTGMIF